MSIQPLPKEIQGYGLGFSPVSQWDSIISKSIERHQFPYGEQGSPDGLTVTIDPSAAMPPELPKLPTLEDFDKAINKGARDYIPGFAAVQDFLDISRWVTVAVGLLLIFGGLYLFGTSQMADALAGKIKGAIA